MFEYVTGKMKVGIITHYNVHNHGAHLQMYALIQQLHQTGAEAAALQFKKSYDFMDAGAENKYNISLKSIPVYARYLLKKGLKRTLYNVKKRKRLASFRTRHALVGEYYSKASGLDCVIVGSDEVFSIEAGLTPCFWGMGVPCDKIIAYAASFGPTTQAFIESHFAKEYVAAGIDRFNAISVRDNNSLDICVRNGGKQIPVVCDPVLLYDFKFERAETRVRTPKSRYCIVYSYDERMNDRKTIEAVKRFAKARNLKIFSVGYYHKWCDKNIQADPLDLFAWFENASYVFTDTFHGSVISLVTNTPFFAKISGNGNKLGFLLEEYGVENRCADFDSCDELEQIDNQSIDFAAVNEIIREKRDFSLRFLKEHLGVD